MNDNLSKRGRSLEEEFFMQKSAQLIAQRKKLEEMKQTKESLGAVSGIKNEKVLSKLVELGITPSTLASLMILPIVEVAWADGVLSDKEKQLILEFVSKGNSSQGALDQGLLGEWLKQKPSDKFLEAWISYVQGLKEVLKPEELAALKQQLLSHAHNVANCEGGFMGVGKISDQEKAILKKMEAAF